MTLIMDTLIETLALSSTRIGPSTIDYSYLDTASLSFKSYHPFCISFREANSSQDIGVLKVIDSQLVFEGSADESARIFFDLVCRQFLAEVNKQKAHE